MSKMKIIQYIKITLLAATLYSSMLLKHINAQERLYPYVLHMIEEFRPYSTKHLLVEENSTPSLKKMYHASKKEYLESQYLTKKYLESHYLTINEAVVIMSIGLVLIAVLIRNGFLSPPPNTIKEKKEQMGKKALDIAESTLNTLGNVWVDAINLLSPISNTIKEKKEQMGNKALDIAESTLNTLENVWVDAINLLSFKNKERDINLS
jgi:hypothetical protein